MKIKKLNLKNYGRFEDLTIDFAPTKEKTSNVTVIVGNNGAGKSQILQALATGLSWFVNGLVNYDKEKKTRPNKEHGFLQSDEGQYIQQSHIMNGKDYSELKLSFNGIKAQNGSIVINSTKKEILKSTIYGINGNGFNDLIKKYAEKFQKNNGISLPIVAYYPVDRGVISTPMDISEDFTTNQLTAYEDSLETSVNFEKFFLWFREREDIENEDIQYIKKEAKTLIDEAEELEEKGLRKEKKFRKLQQEIKDLFYASIYDKSLHSVRQAIEYFTGFKNPRIRRQGTPTMIVEKDGEELDVNQLSQGEKSLLALVGDIARRLAILNPSMDNPLEGEGVVMIDEVDLHLHPKWQHDLIDKLVRTFRNVQFILTTHSPHVISDRNDILVYSLDDGELSQVPNVYGEDVNTVLTKVFGVPIRDKKAQEDFDEVAHLIHDKQFAEAERKIVELEAKMPENLELLRCRLHLTQAQLAEQQEG